MFFPQIGYFAWRVSLVPKVMGKSSGASANEAMLYAQGVMSIQMYFTNLHLSSKVYSS